MQAKTTFSLKDQLFNKETVTYLSGLVAAVDSDFKAKQFVKDVLEPFAELELKQRITHITSCLKNSLPDNYRKATKILLKALPPELDPTKTDDDFGEFILAPISEYVAMYGRSKKDLDFSLKALKEMTKRFTVEGPIRFFINDYPEETVAFLEESSKDDNYHVRRLASEGTRPTLPWNQKLVIDHTVPLPILDNLYDDSTRFVTRSVANHLNDIAKIDPKLVIDTLKRWQDSKKQSEKEMAFITKHALRTLVKKGNKDALNLLGFGTKPDITVSKLISSTPEVIVGNALEFELEIESHKKQNLMIDYVMHYYSTAKKGSTKVFKLKEVAAKRGQHIRLAKKHPLKLMTTKRLYAGEHSITIQINGVDYGSLRFDLLES